MKIEDLFATVSKQLRGDSEAANADVEKTASDESKSAATPEKTEPATEDMDKLAYELYCGGQLMGDGIADRLLEKLAGSGVSAGGYGMPSARGARSVWEQVANQIEGRHVKRSVSTKGGPVTAEQAGALKGQGFSNTQKPLA